MIVTRLGSPPKAAMFSCQDDDRQGGRERLDDDGCEVRELVAVVAHLHPSQRHLLVQQAVIATATALLVRQVAGRATGRESVISHAAKRGQRSM